MKTRIHETTEKYKTVYDQSSANLWRNAFWSATVLSGFQAGGEGFRIIVAVSGGFISAMRIEPSTFVAVLWNCRLVHIPSFRKS